MPSAVLRAEYDTLDWVPVDSSAVEAVAYAPRSGRLYVRWLPRPGARYTVYVYFDVPPSVWDGVRDAPSVGTYVNRVVKRFGYQFVE